MIKAVVAIVDAPDPDNFAQLVAIKRLLPGVLLHVMVTGRPVAFNASAHTPYWDYDDRASRMAQQMSATRIVEFLARCRIDDVNVYDGGIAPRTLVPHSLHFPDYYGFGDIDPLAAICNSQLRPLSELICELNKVDQFSVAVGGPMTGLRPLLEHEPSLVGKLNVITAMFATWGDVRLMQMGDELRGAVQFNVACDPVSANWVLTGLPPSCKLILMPTEVTRVEEIGFHNLEALERALQNSDGALSVSACELLKLYKVWYTSVIKPRQVAQLAKGLPVTERIWIHDLVAALALDTELCASIYDIVPIDILEVVHRPSDLAKDWGTVRMSELSPDRASNAYAAKTLKPGGAERYLAALRSIFA